jgi:hypothetical protein
MSEYDNEIPDLHFREVPGPVNLVQTWGAPGGVTSIAALSSSSIPCPEPSSAKLLSLA